MMVPTLMGSRRRVGRASALLARQLEPMRGGTGLTPTPHQTNDYPRLMAHATLNRRDPRRKQGGRLGPTVDPDPADMIHSDTGSHCLFKEADELMA